MACERHEPNTTVDVGTLSALLQKHFPTNLPSETKSQIITSYAVYVFSQEHCVEEGIIYLGSIASLTTLALYQMTRLPNDTFIQMLQSFEDLTVEIYGQTYLEDQTITKNVQYAFRAAALALLVFNKALRGGLALAAAYYTKYPEGEISWMDMAEEILRQMYASVSNPPARFLPIRAELTNFGLYH